MDGEVGRITVTNFKMWPDYQTVIVSEAECELLVFVDEAYRIEDPLTVIRGDRSYLEKLAEDAVNKGIWVDDVLYPGRRVHRCEIRLVVSEQTPAG